MGLLHSDKSKRIKTNWFLIICLTCFFSGCSYSDEPVLIEDVNGNKKLTLMIYMAADNDLESYALANFKTIEKSITQETNVLVLLDRSEDYDETCGNWTDTRLYEVLHDDGGSSSINSRRLECPALDLSSSEATELDMSNSSVLQKFIEFGKSKYKSEKYALVIWGHGGGWKAFAIDDRSNSYMSVKELGNAIRNTGLDVIGFDTCFGGVIENVYELKDCAEFTVGCPGVSPNSGWDYKSFFEMLSEGDYSSNSIAFAMSKSSRAAASVFENKNVSELMALFENFCKELSLSIQNENDRRQILDSLFASKSYSYTQYPCDMFLDMRALAGLYTSSENTLLSSAAVRLASAADDIYGAGLGLHFIPLESSNIMAVRHSEYYVRNENKTDQCAFIKESRWWVPSLSGDSGSLLDKLFYTIF